MNEGMNVLIVEQDVELRWLMSTHLNASGYRVGDVGDRLSLQEWISTVQCDLVIMGDLEKPGERNRAISEIADGGANISLLFLDRVPDGIVEKLACKSGTPDFLSKPFGASDLVARVGLIAQRRKWMLGQIMLTGEDCVQVGKWKFDLISNRLIGQRDEITSLSETEAVLLRTLIESGGMGADETSIAELLSARSSSGCAVPTAAVMERLNVRLGSDENGLDHIARGPCGAFILRSPPIFQTSGRQDAND